MAAYAHATTKVILSQDVEEGYTIYQNPDGTRTLEVEVTDAQIASMGREDEFDSLQDSGISITNVRQNVDISIKKEIMEMTRISLKYRKKAPL